MAAIFNGYVDVNISAGKLGSNAQVSGGIQKTAVQSFVVAAADTAASVYRVFKGLSPDIIVTALDIWNDALTGASSVTVGAYGVLDYDNVGAAISSACFATGLDLSSAHAITGSPLNGMAAVTIANREVPAWVLYGDAQYPAKHPAWDLCITMVAMTTGATGNVHVKMSYVQL